MGTQLNEVRPPETSVNGNRCAMLEKESIDSLHVSEKESPGSVRWCV